MKGGKGLAKALDKYRKLNSVKAHVGIMEDKTYPDGTPVAAVGFYNDMGTKGIPARPFFRQAIAENKEQLKAVIAKALESTKDPETALRLGGEVMIDAFKDAVMTWSDPPNAPSTVKAKGYQAPLRANDKLLRNSFTVEIKDD